MTRVYAIRLIKPSGQKTLVWEGEAGAHGLVVRYGCEGRKLRTQHIPLAQVPDGALPAALLALAEEKQRQGYQRSWQGWQYRQAGPAEWFY